MPVTPSPVPDTPSRHLGRSLMLCTAGALLIVVALARSAWLLALEHDPAGLILCVLAMVLPGVGLMWLWQHARIVQEHGRLQQAALAEAQAHSERLAGALRSFPDAVALFDAQDRLVLASDRYRSMNPAVAPLLQPGVPFEHILRAAAAAGEVVEAVGNEDNWVRQRMSQHQSLRQDFLQGLAGNRWVRVNECRTPDGGLIGLRTDVSDFVRQQQALQEARSDAQQARRLLVRALDALPAALEIFDEQDRLVIYNRALQNMFPHIDYPQSVGRPFADMVAESLRHHAVVEALGRESEWLAQRLQSRASMSSRSFLQELSGGRWVQAYETRTPEGYVVAIRLDMTEQVKQREALEQAQREGQRVRQLLMDALEALPEGLAVYDTDDRLLMCNTQYRVMYSDLAHLLQPGRPFDELIEYSVTHRHFGQAPKSGETADDWGAQRRASHRQPGPAMLVPMHDGRWIRVHERKTAEKMTVGVHVDVTELVLKEQQLAHANQLLAKLSATDGLTGLHNRRSFDEALAAEWQRCARHELPLALLLVDIDHFKLYNDHYGHLAGDDCLRRVAQVLNADFRRTGEVVARYGGEEFVLLLPGIALAGAREVAQRCLERIRTENIPHAASPTSPRLTLSIGVAAWVPDGKAQVNQAHRLINAADAALYHAKQNGRARYVLASDLKDMGEPPTLPDTDH